MLEDIELIDEILRLQNTVCFLQDQLRMEREMNAQQEVQSLIASECDIADEQAIIEDEQV